MGQDCAESADGRQPAIGWRFNVVKRVHENEALIAFIDLLGTRSLYGGPLPAEDQAKQVFRNLVRRLDIKFCDCFDAQEIQHSFDVSIFADSIVICPRRKIPNIAEQLVEFLLAYQQDLWVNCRSPSRAVLTRDSFFSFKITDTSEESILGSPNTSVSLCGGRGIISAHNCLEGLPIGVYVARDVEPDLTTEQRARTVPVKPPDEYPTLYFIKRREGIDDWLPSETSHLLNERPDASCRDIIDSMKDALGQQDASGRRVRTLGLTWVWDVLRPAVEDEHAFDDKWAPWVLVHLGKQSEIVRSKLCPLLRAILGR